MTRYFLTILIALASISQAKAITANEALAKAIAAVNSAGCITASITAEGADAAASKGTIAISRERFAIVGNDYGVWYDGDSMWSYSSKTGEASLTNPTAEELMEANPFDIINHSSTSFKSTLVSDKGDRCVLRLTAISKSLSVRSATVTFDTRTWLPTNVEASFSNGSEIKIRIADAKIMKTAPALSSFRFPKEKYPNAEVIDLR